MMQKIMFQDNLYQLSHSVDMVFEGLMLDLSDDFFFDKTVDDILFFDAAIRKLHGQLTTNMQIAGYIGVLHSLYSCQKRYLELVDFILTGKTAMQERFVPLYPKLQEIKSKQTDLRTSLVANIGKIDKNNDARDIVSSNELSELLNF